MRGLLASRPIDDVLREGEKLVRAGVRETAGDLAGHQRLWLGSEISQAASWREREYETRFLDLARGLGELGVWVRMHYVYPYPHVDDVIPLMAEGRVLPYLDVPFQHGSPSVLKRMRRPAHADNSLDADPPLARDLSGPDDPQHLHRRLPRRDRRRVR
jgi:ribosomal protein S12 methylthiotransferase